MLRFGYHVGRAPDRAAWRDHVRRVDEWGFDSVCVPDHVGWFDPFAAIAAAASVSERLRFRTYVVNLGFWNPLLLARAAATTDVLTEGRLTLGLGAGHAEVEFRQAGLPYPGAGARTRHLERTVG